MSGINQMCIVRARIYLLACLSATMFATAALAESEKIPIPPIPSMNIPLMARAFASTPFACRVQVQKILSRYGFYDGPNDGTWTPEVANAIASYVTGASGLGYGFSSVAGAKGILWHIGFEEIECPMPPYNS